MANLKYNNILVTGGSGFIGRHLLKSLDQTNAENIFVTSRSLKLGQSTSSPRVKFLDLELKNKAAVTRAITQMKPDLVIHLASNKERVQNLPEVYSSLENNLFGGMNLLASLVQSEVKKIIILGTAEEYGRNIAPFNETLREAPTTAYSLSKVCLTQVAQFFEASFNLPISILRPSITYGPQQQIDMFLPALIHSLGKNQVFKMTSGEQFRDFIYVTDVVDAIFVTAQSDLRGIFNIGSGESVKLKEVASMVARMMGKEELLDFGALPERKNEIINYVVDISKARNELKWNPKVNLKSGLQKLLESVH